MTLELKLKRAMLTTAIDIIVKGAERSPDRCARNLIELGEKAYPETLTKTQQKELYEQLLELCRRQETAGVRDAFFFAFSQAD